jgi:hypothetical protein
MPSFFSAFTSEVFRPLATLLIPGAIAVSTWLIAMVWHFASLRQLASNNHTETSFVIFLVMTFAGLVLEDVGSHFEVWLDDRADERHSGEHKICWNRYLRQAFVVDPIGRRYARTLVLRLKFELGVAFGMISAALGLLWLAFLGLDCKVVLVSGSICLVFLIWNLFEASQTHKILGQTRAELLKEICIVR